MAKNAKHTTRFFLIAIQFMFERKKIDSMKTAVAQCFIESQKNEIE